MTNETRAVTIRIQRFNPEADRKPYLDSFEIQTEQGMTLLDALQKIKTELDGSVTFRRSCRHAICGSCAMNVNGSNMLVCNKPVKSVLGRSGKVTVRPLPYLPVIKDLVVDRTVFWEQYLRVKPWLIPPDEVPQKEMRVSPQEVEALRNAEKCIMCGACYSSCQILATNKNYIGPHALLKAFLRVLDPRDSAPGPRLKNLSMDDGVFRCRTITNCIDACPKNLDPTQAIETLRNLAQKRAAYERQRRDRQKRLAEPVG